MLPKNISALIKKKFSPKDAATIERNWFDYAAIDFSESDDKLILDTAQMVLNCSKDEGRAGFKTQALAHLQSLAAQDIFVYGGIVDLSSNEEYEWDGTPVAEAIADCKKLKGDVYGRNWKFAGDLGLAESDIFLEGASNKTNSYSGKLAVKNFLRDHSNGK